MGKDIVKATIACGFAISQRKSRHEDIQVDTNGKVSTVNVSAGTRIWKPKVYPTESRPPSHDRQCSARDRPQLKKNIYPLTLDEI